MTDHDETRRRRDVTPAQDLAIAALLAGNTITDAADAAGVTRQTVSGWTNHHSDFQVELNEQRIELNKQCRDLVRCIDIGALGALKLAVDDGDAALALQWMKIRKLDTGYISGPVAADSEPSSVGPSPPTALDWLDNILDESIPGRRDTTIDK